VTTPQYLPVRSRPLRGAVPLMQQEEFARRCGLHPELVRRYVALGLVDAVRDADGALWFAPSQVNAVARLLRLRAALPLNSAALGLVVDLLDRITELETLLRIRGRTEPVRPRTATRQSTRSDQERSTRWT
jgi:chaperone modulatory protein CbpM